MLEKGFYKLWVHKTSKYRTLSLIFGISNNLYLIPLIANNYIQICNT